MKDKKWLKEKVRDIARQVGDEYLYINIQTVLELINQLDEPEVPVVPKQEVIIGKEDAKNIVQYKKMGWTLSHLIDDYGEDARHDELLAQAWLAYPDIEVEEEPLYYVMKDGVVILSKRYRDYESHESHWIGTVTNKEYIKENPDKVRFTEQEIKDYDERFWAFAVPVVEVSND